MFIVAIFALLTAVCSAEKRFDTIAEATMPKTYGGATVTKITDVDTGYIFRCDIKDWPSIIGEDIAVRINGVAPPLIVVKGGKPNKFFELQAKKFLERTLGGAKRITLNNIQRGRTFSIVANVIVDSNSLGDLMIGEGLARRYSPDEQGRIAAEYYTGSISSQVAQTGAQGWAGVQSNIMYVASKSSKVFHRSTCRHAKIISPENLVKFDSKAEAVQTGRRPCKTCDP